MSGKRYQHKFFVAFVIMLTSFFIASNKSFATQSDIDIPHASGNIVLDGQLTEDIWQQANVVDLNLVNFPWNNTPSPIKTQVKIVENGKALLIAFIAEDPNPEDIQSYYGDRDTRWDDDLVGIKLDSQNNNRMNYEFIVNPLGMQMDSIQNNITDEKNDLWDGIWHSYGRVTDNGYIVEMEIPFRILNFKQSDEVKSWPIELFRIYPRETWLRISHVKLNKDIACKTCQYPKAKGFKTARTAKNIMLTPSLVVKSEETRDIYDANDNWHHNKEIEAGLDFRWGITSNTLLNATINPDFSFIESDAAQLNVNENFSLNYDEKRPFFLDNSEYFASNFDLIYTRNITDPDYGLKLTGAENNHTYGVFISQDQQTNFILPGNLSSEIAHIDDTSQAAALKYRYDVNKDISFGFISTLRQASQYHNYVAGFDGKYQLTESNSIHAQIINSETEYPDDFYQDFCTGDACVKQLKAACFANNCPYNEQVKRAKQGAFSDQAMKVDFQHRSEYWDIDASHQQIGENFRADLGFMPRADIIHDSLSINRKFFASENSKYWQKADVSATWDIKHNENNELIERFFSGTTSVDGPYLSKFTLTYTLSDEVGLRHDRSKTQIDDNTTKFSLKNLALSSHFKPTNDLYLEFNYNKGDKIDYIHNRLGKLNELESYFSWYLTPQLEIELSHLNSELEADNSNVYQAMLIDSRISYQFDAHSRLKLSIIYCDIERNLDNNPSELFNKRKKELSTQLIYSYKINPQTVFYLGYSDNSYQDDELFELKKENKTFFSKISYAWMP